MTTIGYFVGIVLGIIIGAMAAQLKIHKAKVGVLRVDNSDPDDTYMFLELSKGVGDVSTKQYVVLEVSTESYISQE